MAFALGSRASQAGHTLEAFDRLDSTNSLGLERARAGERGPLWIVTSLQTGGRGRRGREWSGGQGNFAGSLLMTLDVAPAVAATLGFVAGLALDEAIAALRAGRRRAAQMAE